MLRLIPSDAEGTSVRAISTSAGRPRRARGTSASSPTRHAFSSCRGCACRTSRRTCSVAWRGSSRPIGSACTRTRSAARRPSWTRSATRGRATGPRTGRKLGLIDGAGKADHDAHAEPVLEADLRLPAGGRLSRATRADLLVTVSAISLDVAEVEALLARIAPLVTKADHECLKSLVGTLIEVTRLARQRGATISASCSGCWDRRAARRRRTSSARRGPRCRRATAVRRRGGQDGPVPDEPPRARRRTGPRDDTGGAAEGNDKPRRKGHGRLPGSAYMSETIAVPHSTLCTETARVRRARTRHAVRDEGARLLRARLRPGAARRRSDGTARACAVAGAGSVFTALLPEEEPEGRSTARVQRA